MCLVPVYYKPLKYACTFISHKKHEIMVTYITPHVKWQDKSSNDCKNLVANTLHDLNNKYQSAEIMTIYIQRM